MAIKENDYAPIFKKIKSGLLSCAIFVVIQPFLSAITCVAQETPPLISAIRNGDLAAVERECNSNTVNIHPPRSTSWDYPILEACGNTNLDILNLLIRNGADVNVHTTSTPLMTAFYNKWGDGVRCLIEHGAARQGITPLMMAVIDRNYDEIGKLATNAKMLEARNFYDRSAVDYAADRRSFAILLHCGATSPYDSLTTAAVLDDTNQLAKELYKIPSIKTSFDAKAALDRAIEFDSRNAVQLMLQAKVNMDRNFPEELTALCVAAKYGRFEIVKMLLDAGAQPNGACDGVFLPAYYARIFHHTNCLTLLPAGQGDYIPGFDPGKGVDWTEGDNHL